jgi:hypothetical protein
VFVHVVSAVVLVGGGLLATPTIHGAIRRASTVADLRRWLVLGKPLGRINLVSSLTLLASGIYLSSVGEWWGAAWVQVAVALWLVNATLARAVMQPSMARLAQAAFAAEGEEISPELDGLRGSPRLAVTSEVMLANDVGVLFLMVAKPSGILIPLLVLAVAQVALFGFRRTRQAAHARSTGWKSPATS